MDVRQPLLHVLLDRALSGYEIARLLRKTAPGIAVKGEGTIYPFLQMLEHQKLIRARWRRAASGRIRRDYSLTPKGRKWLSGHASPPV